MFPIVYDKFPEDLQAVSESLKGFQGYRDLGKFQKGVKGVFR